MLTIIVPARNEEKTIIKTLDGLISAVNVPFEIVVVNDCSVDNTKQVVKTYSKGKRVRVVDTTPKRKGFASALKKGFTSAKGKFVVPVMADLCDNPSTINKMYKEIGNGWDVVCGSRYMRGGKKAGGPKLQGFFSWLVCNTAMWLTGVPTRDISNAFKMYRKKSLKGIRYNPKGGVEASMEILFQIYFNGGKITEIPTQWKGRTVGTSKFKLFQRTPRYLKIYSWAVENSLRKAFHLKLKPFYIK